MKKLSRKEVFKIVNYLNNIKTEDMTVNEIIINELNFPDFQDRINYQSIKYILEEFELPFKKKEPPKDNPLTQRIFELEELVGKLQDRLNRIEAALQ